MDEKQLSLFCLFVICIGLILFVINYQDDFSENKSALMNFGDKAKLFGRIDYIIKNNPSTTFILNDGNTITVYYQKNTDLAKNDFVTIYGEKQIYNGKEEIYAYKVIKE